MKLLGAGIASVVAAWVVSIGGVSGLYGHGTVDDVMMGVWAVLFISGVTMSAIGLKDVK